ncbi:MAG: hypothetical protein KDA65_18250 [Planctomycetaceae bacterium]|nr:hypothetical protein [Planctomycetaceae bacterium]
MSLEPGQRLPGLRWSHYQVDQLQRGKAYSPLYSASKILFNHRYDEQEFYEASQEEWLPVWIRTTITPESNDAEELQSRIRLLRYEMESVLTTNCAWTPLPLDWIEFPATNKVDESPETEGKASSLPAALLVFTKMNGETLKEAQATWPEDSLLRVRFLTEWLNFLQLLHDRKQCLGAISPEEILVDRSGQFQILATDRILPVVQTEPLRWYYPPERYPVSFSAPEIREQNAGFDVRSDLYNWACFALYLVGGIDLEHRAPIEEEPLTSEELGKLSTNLEKLVTHYLVAMKSFAPGRFGKSEQLVVGIWRAAILQALKTIPAERPATITELRNVAVEGRTVQKVAEKFKSWFRPVERRTE